jgi:hypothetical protein
MGRRRLLPAAVLATALAVILALPCRAGRVRYHYAPADACGTMSMKPDGPCGAAGEVVSFFGAVREPAPAPPRPTHLLTFQHPCTARPVTVPVCLPEGTPRVEYRTDWVVYNYGSYAVQVHFLGDGSVDVVYNSGLFRAP